MMLRLVILLLLSLGLSQAQANTFVHLFEWRWSDIAKECETFLSKHNYTAVQISPPNEHRMLLGRPWYERYQPVSYRLESRSGSRDELIDMIDRCHGVNVKIYVDAVVNHMASCRPECDKNQPQYGNLGVDGSTYQPGAYHFAQLFDEEDRSRIPDSLDAYWPQHFHRTCQAVEDWSNIWQLHNCELEGLADLATERDDVRATIANYLASLFALGVDGLRIDAAKHLPPNDLRGILSLAAYAANVHIEGTDINPDAPKSVVVFQEYIGDPPDPFGAYGNGKVTEFNFGIAQSKAFLNWDGLLPSRSAALIQEWDMQPSDKVVTFIDNHDNQRGHGGGGDVFAHKGEDGRNYGIRNNLPTYRLANIFMLAYPYGYPKIMSSYAFGDGELWDNGNPIQDIYSVAGMPVHDDFIGPPHIGQHEKDLSENDYAAAPDWRTEQILSDGDNGSRCDASSSKWLCEHRWPAIAGMTGFRAATTPAWHIDHWWDDGRNRLSFSRGDRGFVVINGELHSDRRAFGPEDNGWYYTNLPPGKYCDIIQSSLSEDGTRCKNISGATIEPIVIYPDGKAHILVNKMDAVAIHIDARILE